MHKHKNFHNKSSILTNTDIRGRYMYMYIKEKLQQFKEKTVLL